MVYHLTEPSGRIDCQSPYFHFHTPILFSSLQHNPVRTRMVEITYQMILSTIQTASLVVGIVYYLTIMRNTQKTRELSLKAQEEAERARQREMILLRFHSFDREWARAWTNVLFQDVNTLEKWQKVFNPIEEPENFADMIFLQTRYQNIGLMLKESIIEPDLLFQIYQPDSVLSAWEQYEVNIRYRREFTNDPTYQSGFEYLYVEAKKRYPDISTRERSERMHR
jgi:hypothetical protein